MKLYKHLPHMFFYLEYMILVLGSALLRQEVVCAQIAFSTFYCILRR